MALGQVKRAFWLGLGLLVVLALVGASAFYLHPLEANDLKTRFHLWKQHVKSEYVQVDGYRIHYFEAKSPHFPGSAGDGRPLVLVHGLGSRGEDWSPLIPTLASQGFHVYALDLLGYGRSPRPDVDYSIQLEEQTVVDFMQAMHLGHADIAGWSMGGWIVLSLAVDHSELVDRLVIYDAPGIYFPPTFGNSLFTPTDTAGLLRLTSMLSPHPQPFPPFVARAAIKRLQANAWILDRSVSSMTSGRDLLDFKLQKIDKPTLLVWGGADRLIPLSVGVTMHARIPHSSLLVVDGCGHLAPAECSRPVLRGTLKFLLAEPAIQGGESTVPGVRR